MLTQGQEIVHKLKHKPHSDLEVASALLSIRGCSPRGLAHPHPSSQHPKWRGMGGQLKLFLQDIFRLVFRWKTIGMQIYKAGFYREPWEPSTFFSLKYAELLPFDCLVKLSGKLVINLVIIFQPFQPNIKTKSYSNLGQER